jgi:hypothetical protein
MIERSIKKRKSRDLLLKLIDMNDDNVFLKKFFDKMKENGVWFREQIFAT